MQLYSARCAIGPVHTTLKSLAVSSRAPATVLQHVTARTPHPLRRPRAGVELRSAYAIRMVEAPRRGQPSLTNARLAHEQRERSAPCLHAVQGRTKLGELAFASEQGLARRLQPTTLPDLLQDCSPQTLRGFVSSYRRRFGSPCHICRSTSRG